jgi:AraC family transcriptional regulator, arabinose operon regulatory protein
MDDSMNLYRLMSMLAPDGFPGQRLLVLPRPLVEKSLRRPITSQLLVTDVGYFPRAATHGRYRPEGSDELIVIVCAQGLGWCEVDDHLVAVPAGSVLVIPAQVPHLYRADENDPWTIWWCHLVGDDIDSLVSPLQGSRLVVLTDVFRVVAGMSRILQQMERDETTVTLIAAAGDAWSLMAQIAADRIAGSSGPVEPIRAAQDHLRERLAEPVGVPELARLAGLSTSHFAALFRRATGGGVTAYLKSLRMARARELLDTTDRPVGEIARLVGYPDPFYFSRHFRSVNGCSPTEYRARR